MSLRNIIITHCVFACQRKKRDKKTFCASFSTPAKKRGRFIYAADTQESESSHSIQPQSFSLLLFSLISPLRLAFEQTFNKKEDIRRVKEVILLCSSNRVRSVKKNIIFWTSSTHINSQALSSEKEKVGVSHCRSLQTIVLSLSTIREKKVHHSQQQCHTYFVDISMGAIVERWKARREQTFRSRLPFVVLRRRMKRTTQKNDDDR
jgi:hypothetical protein